MSKAKKDSKASEAKAAPVVSESTLVVDDGDDDDRGICSNLTCIRHWTGESEFVFQALILFFIYVLGTTRLPRRFRCWLSPDRSVVCSLHGSPVQCAAFRVRHPRIRSVRRQSAVLCVVVLMRVAVRALQLVQLPLDQVPGQRRLLRFPQLVR
jgi:hypothetical protein